MKYLIKYTDSEGPLFYIGINNLLGEARFDTYKHAALFFTREQANRVLKNLTEKTSFPNAVLEVISTSEDIDIKVDPSSYYNYYMQVSQNQTGSYSQAEFVDDFNEGIRFFIPSENRFNRMVQLGSLSEHQQFEILVEEDLIYDYASIKDAADHIQSIQQSASLLTLAKILEDLNQEQL